MNNYNFEEHIDCAAEDLVYDIKESIKTVTRELKISIREIIEELNYDFFELREGLLEVLEDISDSAHGREYF